MSTEPAMPLPGGGYADPPEQLTEFQREVAEVVAGLQVGELITYGEVALESGHPGAGQAVANVLRRVPGLPWWRVLSADGRLYCQHREVAEPLLEAEGHTVDEMGRVQVVTGSADRT
ncbi:MGMT family protein [Aeromicrobium sp. CF3.5]|uniref:MGMT family protein n=1 Tax=Aeromicrobium sp. CF3.5 TaxID=3373078 RepID=UPI003EE7D3BF